MGGRFEKVARAGEGASCGVAGLLWAVAFCLPRRASFARPRRATFGGVLLRFLCDALPFALAVVDGVFSRALQRRLSLP